MGNPKLQGLEHFDRVKADLANLNRICDSITTAAETTEAVMSFRSRRLLERARDNIEDATLLLRESMRLIDEKAKP